jgi:hypothetical protein
VLRRLVFVAFFVEVGLLLIVLPWSAFWEQNYFGSAWPVLRPVFFNNFVRGGVTGLGLVNLVAGVFELMPMVVVRHEHGNRLRGPDSTTLDTCTGNPDAQVEP